MSRGIHDLRYTRGVTALTWYSWEARVRLRTDISNMTRSEHSSRLDWSHNDLMATKAHQSSVCPSSSNLAVFLPKSLAHLYDEATLGSPPTYCATLGHKHMGLVAPEADTPSSVSGALPFSTQSTRALKTVSGKKPGPPPQWLIPGGA